jgi:hypothetical protein
MSRNRRQPVPPLAPEPAALARDDDRGAAPNMWDILDGDEDSAALPLPLRAASVDRARTRSLDPGPADEADDVVATTTAAIGTRVPVGRAAPPPPAGRPAHMRAAAAAGGSPVPCLVGATDAAQAWAVLDVLLGGVLAAAGRTVQAGHRYVFAFGDALEFRDADGTRTEVVAPGPLLRHMELGLSSAPGAADDDPVPRLFRAATAAGAVLWVSSAARPWNDAETRLWSGLPGRVRDRSLLVLTDAERAVSEAGRPACERKLAAAAPFFRAVLPLSLDTARRAAPGGAIVDAEAFAASGARALVAAVGRLVRDIRDDARTAPAPGPTPSSSGPALRREIERACRTCMAALGQPGAAAAGILFPAIADILRRMASEAGDPARFGADGLPFVAAITEAADLVDLLAFEGDAIAVSTAASLFRQIAVEFLIRTGAPSAPRHVPAREESPVF